jgi:hypothetical protein
MARLNERRERFRTKGFVMIDGKCRSDKLALIGMEAKRKNGGAAGGK